MSARDREGMQPVQHPQEPGREGHGVFFDRLPGRPQPLGSAGAKRQVTDVPGEQPRRDGRHRARCMYDA
ncbi:hypothetical protein [Streptomyces sp. YIM S03343]